MKLFLSILITTICFGLNAQNVLLSDSSYNAEPHSSAIFEIVSKTKGFLPPRMTVKERNKIFVDSAAQGLIIYQTDTPQGFYYYSDNGWIRLSTSQTINSNNDTVYLYNQDTILFYSYAKDTSYCYNYDTLRYYSYAKDTSYFHNYDTLRYYSYAKDTSYFYNYDTLRYYSYAKDTSYFYNYDTLRYYSYAKDTSYFYNYDTLRHYSYAKDTSYFYNYDTLRYYSYSKDTSYFYYHDTLVDKRVDLARKNLLDSLAAERNRAIVEELAIQNKIDVEHNRGVAEELKLSNQIITENNRAVIEELKITNQISAESNRAIAEELKLINQISAESNRAVAEELKLSNQISSERSKILDSIDKERHRSLQAEQVLQDTKVDKIPGKGLSTVDYKKADSAKLACIADEANNYVHPYFGDVFGIHKVEYMDPILDIAYGQYFAMIYPKINTEGHIIGTKLATFKMPEIIDSNYVHTDNNYSNTEKNKLAGIATNAEVNVQGNWTQTNTNADDYIKNKPDLSAIFGSFVNNNQIDVNKFTHLNNPQEYCQNDPICFWYGDFPDGANANACNFIPTLEEYRSLSEYSLLHDYIVLDGRTKYLEAPSNLFTDGSGMLFAFIRPSLDLGAINYSKTTVILKGAVTWMLMRSFRYDNDSYDDGLQLNCLDYAMVSPPDEGIINGIEGSSYYDGFVFSIKSTDNSLPIILEIYLIDKVIYIKALNSFAPNWNKLEALDNNIVGEWPH